MKVKNVRQRVLLTVTILFALAMIFLTIFARDLHEKSLPKVTTVRLQTSLFADENGGSIGLLAIEKKQYDIGEIYVLFTRQKNGEERNFVKKVDVKIGRENEEYYEVIEGISSRDKVVMGCEGEIFDGCEVAVK